MKKIIIALLAVVFVAAVVYAACPDTQKGVRIKTQGPVEITVRPTDGSSVYEPQQIGGNTYTRTADPCDTGCTLSCGSDVEYQRPPRYQWVSNERGIFGNSRTTSCGLGYHGTRFSGLCSNGCC